MRSNGVVLRLLLGAVRSSNALLSDCPLIVADKRAMALASYQTKLTSFTPLSRLLSGNRSLVR